MCDVHKCITLSTIMQKVLFDLNFWSKVFEVKESDGAICFDL